MPYPIKKYAALRLAGNNLVQVVASQDTCTLSNQTHTLELRGLFARALLDHIEHKKHVLLHQIEKNNPWLTGLSISEVVKKGDVDLILGASLGMLFIELTSRCNERCIHCYADSSPDRNDFLPLEKIKLTLKQALDMGQPFIQFTGGDPLIHPDMIASVAYAHAIGLQDIEIFTNGLLLKGLLFQSLIPYSPRFCFSLYSHDAAIHDAITCVAGSLEKTIAAIRRVQTQGLEVRIGIALMQQNADSLANTMQYLQEELHIPAHFVRIDPINATGRGSEVQPAKNIHIKHTSSSHAPEKTGGQNQRLGKLSISANGDVHPCVFSRDIVLGNIHQHPLQEILASLSHTPNAEDSEARWQACKKRLSCHDCQIIAYHLGA